MDECEECGFVYDLARASQAGQWIRKDVGEFAFLLKGPEMDLTTRPQPGTWSPLEYACHLRDLLLVQRERVLAARRVDRPSCESMGREQRVDHDGYAQQVPGDVARQLADAAQMFVNVLDRLSPGDWDRTLLYTYPEPSERPLRWVALRTAHESSHHLLDIRQQLE